MVGTRPLRFRAPPLPNEGDLSTLAKRMKYARACRDVSRGLAAECFRVASETLKDYERGRRSTPYELVRLMAYAYDVPIDWLVDGVGDVPCKPASPATRLARGVLATDPEKAFRARINVEGARWRNTMPRVAG